MFEQQRQVDDVKPLPPLPSQMTEETIENDRPGSTTSDQKEASGLFKKLASKLISPAARQLNTTPTPPTRGSTIRGKSAPPLANDFTSKEQREAALRERGLIATPKKDLSQVEQDLDRKYAKITPVPRDQTTRGGQQSAAERIRQEWKAKNEASRI